MSIDDALTTAEDLYKLSSDVLCELVRGEIRQMTPAEDEHGQVSAKITLFLGGYVYSQRLGPFFDSETGYVLSRNPDTVLSPDFSFIRKERRKGPSVKFVEGAPDLAVEVISPTDRRGQVTEKIRMWLEAGTAELWVVEPKTHTVTIHRPGQKPVVFAEGDTLKGSSVLPDFSCEVSAIFELG